MGVQRLVPLVGFVLLALGIPPLLARDAEPPPAPPPPAAVEAPVTGTAAVETVELTPPRVDGLAAPIVRVLHARGFLGASDQESLAGELPASVIAVLVDDGAVLAVAVESP